MLAISLHSRYCFFFHHRDEDFNDVVLKEEVEDVVGGAEREDLSQEKSRVGLGEV